MRARWVCRVTAVLAGLLGGVLGTEARLGRAILPWEEPDATTGTAALFLLLLGLLVGFAGEFAALRERVERLEQDRRHGERDQA
jgi:H+/Cl- antiporter ClcA